MKKAILIVVAVLLLIGGGLTAYIANFDWNSYKGEIASRFSNTLGKKIEFGGDLSVSILPKPHINVKNVNILNPQNGEKLALVKNVEATLSLKALLDGTPEVETLSLIGAELWYLVDENGNSNWQGQRGHFLDSGIEYNRQTVHVQNALVHYQNKKRTISAEFEQVNADVVAESLTGPYRIDGNFINRGDNYGFAVGLGDISQTDDVFLNFAVTHPRTNSYILYDGSYNFSNSHFEGNFSGEFQQPASLVNIMLNQEMLPEMLNLPFIFSVHLKSDSLALQMTSLALKFAEIIEGSGNVNVPKVSKDGAKPRIDIDYKFATLDIRPLLMGAQLAFEAYRHEKMPYEPQTDYNLHFDLAMQRLVIGETADSVLENVSLKGNWQNEELNVDEYYAACPGNVVWTMNGSLLNENKIPTFFIKNRVEGKNFAAFARAFGINLQAPSQSAYRDIDATFNIIGMPLNFSVSDLKIALDKTKAEGLINFNFEGEQPRYELDFGCDDINFDNYLSFSAEAESLTDKVRQNIETLAFLKNAQWQIDANIASAVFRGVPLQKLALKLNSDKDAVHILELSADNILGAEINVATDINGIGGEDLAFSNLQYKLNTKDISPIISKFGMEVPEWDIFKNKPMTAEGTVNGNLHEADVLTNIVINKTQFYYRGKIAQHDYFEFDGQSSLKTTNFSGLVNDLGGHWEKLKNNSAFNCGGKIVGRADNWSLSEADCVLGTAKYGGQIEVRHEQDMWYVNANVQTSEFDLANVLEVQSAKNNITGGLSYADDFINRPNFSRDVYNFSAYRPLVLNLTLSAERVVWEKILLQNVSTHILNEQNKLRLEDLKFGYEGGEYTGNIVIDYVQKPRVNGKLSADNVKLENIGGKIYKLTSGDVAFSAEFSSAAGSVEEFIGELSGQMDFSIRNFGFDGLDFEAIAQDLQSRSHSNGVFQMVRDNLQQGHTNFSSFSGKVKMNGGVWNFENAQLNNDIIAISMKGEDDLSNWRMHNDFKAKFKKLDLPEFSFVMSGLINKPAVEVNVDELVEKYDAYWAEIERQKQLSEDKERQLLEEDMVQNQQKVSELSARVNELTAIFDKHIQQSAENQYRQWYKQQMDRLNYIGTQADEMSAVARQVDYTQDDITKIKERLREYSAEIEKMSQQLGEKYYQDLQEQLRTQKDISDVFKTDNGNLYEEYQLKWKEKTAQLVQYGGASDEVDKNSDVQAKKLKIEDLRRQFWDNSYKLADMVTLAEKIDNTEDLQKQVKEIDAKTATMQMLNQQMEQLNQEIFEYIDTLVADKKAAYDAEQERLKVAQQKEREENKDNLLANEDNSAQKREKPGISQTIEPLPVLRAIENHYESGVSGTITKSYEDKPVIVPVSRGVLRPAEGDIKPVSGSIITK